jgi:hypothetical protein
MGKLLGAVHLLMFGFLLLAALGAAVLPFIGGAEAGADYVRAQWDLASSAQDAAILRQSIKVNQDLVDAVIGGRMSLREAAVAMCAENENRPSHLRAPPFPFGTMSLEESYMRRILFRVEIALEADSRRVSVLRRLRAEMETVSPGAAAVAAIDHDPQ